MLEEHVVVGAQPPLSTVPTAAALNSPLSTSFYGYDGHNNVRYLTDASANVTDTYDYDAFGTLIAQYGSTPNNYLYCGQQFDADLGQKGSELTIDVFVYFVTVD